MRDCKQDFMDVKGTSYISDIPIEEFENLSDLEQFVKYMKENGLGTALHYETSNFHCGVVVQVYDKESCTVKEFLGR